jgi:hypothetical protein
MEHMAAAAVAVVTAVAVEVDMQDITHKVDLVVVVDQARFVLFGLDQQDNSHQPA